MDHDVVLVSARGIVHEAVMDAVKSAGVRCRVAASLGGGGASVGPCRWLLVDSGFAGEVPPGGWPAQPEAESPLVVHLPGERAQGLATASRVGAHVVVELPVGVPWLSRYLQGAGPRPLMVVAGATGGAGATTVALACAAAAAPDALLVDADPFSVGLDVPLGLAARSAATWLDVPESPGPLVAESLRSAMPRLQGVTVVTGHPPGSEDGRLAAVLAAGRAGFAATVVDVGRSVDHIDVGPADRVVLVARAGVAGVLACRRILADVPRSCPVIIAVRGRRWLPVDEIGDHVGRGLATEIPRLSRLAEAAEVGQALAGRSGRELIGVGERLWAAAS